MNNIQQNNKSGNNKFAELLEKSKLSRMSRLSKLPPLNLDHVPFPVRQIEEIICVNCKVKLSKDDDFARMVKVCRKCLGMHAVIDSALNDAADQRSKEAKLQKFAGGV